MLRRLLIRLLCWLLGHMPRDPHAHGWQTCRRCRTPFREPITFPIVRMSPSDELVFTCPWCGWSTKHALNCQEPPREG